MSDDPQALGEQRHVARHLLAEPLTCAEHDPELFRLIRRHESQLDRWFTQRLGYRLHVDADTARLYKSGIRVGKRPLRTASDRALRQHEHTLLALVLASTAAGPAVISLRDLVAQVRSAAAEAEVDLPADAAGRRALVAVLRWMIDHGLASELHSHIEAYAASSEADAVLKLRPDRIALIASPALVGATSPEELLARAERRDVTRQWMRCLLAETPVIYRDDLTEAEWTELRRRLGEEERQLDEMFALAIEARAEGVAAIDPTGALSQRRFPATGTVGHCALLLVETLPATPVSMPEVIEIVSDLAERNGRNWAADYVASPDRLTRHSLALLEAHCLVHVDRTAGTVATRPGAARYQSDPVHGADATQESLW